MRCRASPSHHRCIRGPSSVRIPAAVGRLIAWAAKRHVYDSCQVWWLYILCWLRQTRSEGQLLVSDRLVRNMISYVELMKDIPSSAGRHQTDGSSTHSDSVLSSIRHQPKVLCKNTAGARCSNEIHAQASLIPTSRVRVMPLLETTENFGS